MQTTETQHGQILFTSQTTDRAAMLSPWDGDLTFGRIDKVDGFVVRPRNCSRTYSTRKGADRAAAKWIANGYGNR